MEDDATFRPSCFCPSGLMDKSALNLRSTGTDESTRSSASHPTRQQLGTDDEALIEAVAFRSFAPVSRRSPLDQQLLQTMESVESSAETTAVQEEVSDSTLFLRGRIVSDSVAEQEEEVVVCCFSLLTAVVICGHSVSVGNHNFPHIVMSLQALFT